MLTTVILCFMHVTSLASRQASLNSVVYLDMSAETKRVLVNMCTQSVYIRDV